MIYERMGISVRACVGSISPSSSEIVCGLYYYVHVWVIRPMTFQPSESIDGVGESLHHRTPFSVICALCASLALNRPIEDWTTTTLDLLCTVLGDTICRVRVRLRSYRPALIDQALVHCCIRTDRQLNGFFGARANRIVDNDVAIVSGDAADDAK